MPEGGMHPAANHLCACTSFSLSMPLQAIPASVV